MSLQLNVKGSSGDDEGAKSLSSSLRTLINLAMRGEATEECEIADFCVACFTRDRYTPKPLDTDFDKLCVIQFGLVFCMNIALNNFSWSLIASR